MPFELWNTWKDSNITGGMPVKIMEKEMALLGRPRKRYFGLKGRIPVYTRGVSIKFHRTSEREREGERGWKKVWGKHRGKMDGGKETASFTRWTQNNFDREANLKTNPKNLFENYRRHPFPG